MESTNLLMERVKKTSLPLKALINIFWFDAFMGVVLFMVVIVAAMADHELIVRLLILSIYTICPMAALDFVRHVSMVLAERQRRHLYPADKLNSPETVDLVWSEETPYDSTLLWQIPPVVSFFFLVGSIIDFALYVNHELEAANGECNDGCVVSSLGLAIASLLTLGSLVYIILMSWVIRRLKK